LNLKNVHKGGKGTLSIHFYLLLIILLLAFYIDVRSSKIPNYLTVSGICLGIGYHILDSGLSGITFSLLGFIVGFGVLFLLYLCKALGAGDVKLFGAIGALSGAEFVVQSMMYSILYAGVLGACILLIRKELIYRIKNVFFRLLSFIFIRHDDSIRSIKKEEIIRFPFMYAVLPGVFTAYYFYMAL
jgi:prepilin peptidase CpaA